MLCPKQQESGKGFLSVRVNSKGKERENKLYLDTVSLYYWMSEYRKGAPEARLHYLSRISSGIQRCKSRNTTESFKS